ncbi:hypothetical protein QF015_000504 [Paenarthrobacter sp. TE4293]|uniref:hypothetical protein n=1 Tax=Paenarthrobacter sp. TE4293 TaxID=3381695 RepID=UPI003D1B1C70
MFTLASIGEGEFSVFKPLHEFGSIESLLHPTRYLPGLREVIEFMGNDIQPGIGIFEFQISGIRLVEVQCFGVNHHVADGFADLRVPLFHSLHKVQGAVRGPLLAR